MEAAPLLGLRGRPAGQADPRRAWLVIGLLVGLLGVLLHQQPTADHAISADLPLPPTGAAQVPANSVLHAGRLPVQVSAETSSHQSPVEVEPGCKSDCVQPELLVACALLITLVAAAWRLKAPRLPRRIPPLGMAAPNRVPIRHQWRPAPNLLVLAISRT